MIPGKCMEATLGVLAEVAGERVRQNAKWGPQDCPSVNSLADHVSAETRAEWYGIPSEQVAKARCERRFLNGKGTYADIAIEEVSEAICAGDEAARRAELVQCAAVFVAWIEAIDRRSGQAVRGGGDTPPPTSAAVASIVMTDAGVAAWRPQPSFITAGIDVACNRLEVEVAGWRPGQ